MASSLPFFSTLSPPSLFVVSADSAVFFSCAASSCPKPAPVEIVMSRGVPVIGALSWTVSGHDKGAVVFPRSRPIAVSGPFPDDFPAAHKADQTRDGWERRALGHTPVGTVLDFFLTFSFVCRALVSLLSLEEGACAGAPFWLRVRCGDGRLAGRDAIVKGASGTISNSDCLSLSDGSATGSTVGFKDA